MMGKVARLVICLLAVAAATGCDNKSKAGGKCATHTDCGEGLVCAKDKTCQSSVATTPTATGSATAAAGDPAAGGTIPAEVPFCTLAEMECDPGDFEGCSKLCEEGKAVACRQLWRWYGFETATAAQHDEAKRDEFQKKQIALDTPACDKGQACACARLFDNHAKGHGVEREGKTAVKWGEKACEAGDPGSCELLGDVYLNGLPVDVGKDRGTAKKHYARAAALRQSACDKNKLVHCAYLGTQYISGMGVKRSSDKGISLARKACTQGEPLGCMVLGDLYRSGRLPDIKKNPRSARDNYQSACRLKLNDGCVQAKKVESENPAG